jgi:hypothetical protein
LVLTSDTFRRSPHLVSILQYLGTKYIEGASQELKEYSIAVEALGKPPDFDPGTNSAVRVELHRLREKLNAYYESEGASDPIKVVLKPGSYIPLFVPRSDLNGGGNISSRGSGSEDGSTGQPSEQPAVSNIFPVGVNTRDHSGISPKQGVKWLFVWVMAALTLTVLAIAAIRELRQVRSASATPTTLRSSSTVPTTAVWGESPVRIIAGYFKDKYVASSGEVFSGDRFFRGGNPMDPHWRFIAGTRDPAVFAYGRAGDFSYDIPLRPGSYELWLFFAETEVGPGAITNDEEGIRRQFDVELNGEPLLPDFDPYSDARGNFIADARVFKDVGPASDGVLHLKFKTVARGSIVNALEVLPSTRGRVRPIRLVAQNNTVTDREGQVWEPDEYFRGGFLKVRRIHVEGTPEPDLYAGMRISPFEYAIPAAEGKYGITLYFAETYYGSLAPGGVGKRVFDIYCNGKTLVQNLDVLKEAGGANRALKKTFHGLQPNGLGKLMLTFVPVRDLPIVNAIEVTDESK